MSDADRTATGISVTTSQPDTLTPANILDVRLTRAHWQSG